MSTSRIFFTVLFVVFFYISCTGETTTVISEKEAPETGVTRVCQVYAFGDFESNYDHPALPKPWYPTVLQELLGGSWNIINKGISGEYAAATAARLQLEAITPGDADYLIIMSGVDDMIENRDAGTIETSLQAMYTAARNAGIKVIAVTHPPFKGASSIWSETRQNVVNDLNYWILHTATDVDYRIDTYSALEDPNNPDCQLPAYTTDGLHLTVAGSAQYAQTIYNGVTWTPVTTNEILQLSNNVALNQNLRTNDYPTFAALNINQSSDTYYSSPNGLNFLDGSANMKWRLYRALPYYPGGSSRLRLYSSDYTNGDPAVTADVHDILTIDETTGDFSFHTHVGAVPNNKYDLGALGNRFRDIYAARYLYAGKTAQLSGLGGPESRIVVADANGTLSAPSAAWVTPTFNANNFTASGSMIWTVSAGNVTTMAYNVIGKTMNLSFAIFSTTVAGTPGDTLFITIPGGYVAAKTMYTVYNVSDNGTNNVARLRVVAGDNRLQLNKDVSANNWGLSTSKTSVFGQITFEVQ